MCTISDILRICETLSSRVRIRGNFLSPHKKTMTHFRVCLPSHRYSCPVAGRRPARRRLSLRSIHLYRCSNLAIIRRPAATALTAAVTERRQSEGTDAAAAGHWVTLPRSRSSVRRAQSPVSRRWFGQAERVVRYMLLW